ncbi:MAG: redoxin domain-containing protein [Chloroflexi bacterium]|nr:redoxin domain-containing protein [Chloroflexota bacterium]
MAALVVLVAGALAFALGSLPGTTPATTVVGAHPLVGRPAPDFTLDTLDGRRLSLAEFRGRPVIVNFWASYCEPCKVEFPLFKAARDRHAGAGLEILGVIKDDDDLGAARAFAESQRATWPLLPDLGGRTVDAYRVAAVPLTFYLDRNGIVRAVSFGPPPSGVLDEHLAKIL